MAAVTPFANSLNQQKQEEENVAAFFKEFEDSLSCRMSLELMSEPVLAGDGCLYDKHCFEEYLKALGEKKPAISSKTGLEMPKTFTLNEELRDLIKIYNKAKESRNKLLNIPIKRIDPKEQADQDAALAKLFHEREKFLEESTSHVEGMMAFTEKLKAEKKRREEEENLRIQSAKSANTLIQQQQEQFNAVLNQKKQELVNAENGRLAAVESEKRAKEVVLEETKKRLIAEAKLAVLQKRMISMANTASSAANNNQVLNLNVTNKDMQDEYEFLASKNDIKAIMTLAFWHGTGAIGVQDLAAAQKYYAKAMVLGHPDAKAKLDELTSELKKQVDKKFAAEPQSKLSGSPSKANDALPLDIFEEHYQAALKHLKETPPNEKLAIEKLMLAAADGHPGALYELGIIYQTSNTDFRDKRKAMNCFSKAVQQQYLPAYSKLGFLWEKGTGKVPGTGVCDGYTAYQFYYDGYMLATQVEEAARDKKTVGELMVNLGRCFEFRIGPCVQSGESAIEWYEAAVTYGNIDGIYNLGRIYEIGVQRAAGTFSNKATALRYYNKAAALGHPIAVYKLGEYHEKGIAGIKSDKAIAISYYTRAASLGEIAAKDSLKRLGLNDNEIENRIKQANAPLSNVGVDSKLMDEQANSKTKTPLVLSPSAPAWVVPSNSAASTASAASVAASVSTTAFECRPE